MIEQQKGVIGIEQGALYELPGGWVWTKLEEASEIILGQSPPSSTYNETRNGLPFYQGKLEFGNIYPIPKKWCTVPKKIAEKGDVLISVRAPVGPTNICPKKSCIGRGLAAIRPLGGIETLFILYFLRAFENVIAGKGTGTTFNAITGAQLREFEVPLPPLSEQRAIVAKIEQLFSDLDNGIANLKNAQKQLKIYRQAVLKKAFEGELTRKWREEQTDLPSAEELLQQIREEREKDYQKQLDEWKKAVKKWEDNGKERKKPSRPKKPKELPPLTEKELVELPELPEVWGWVKFGNVCLKIFDGTHFSPKNYDDGVYKYITAKNIKEGRFDLSKITYVIEEDHKKIYARCDVKKGDVLYIKDGATTGKATVNYLDEEFSLLSSVGVFRTNQQLIVSKFIEHYLNSESTRNRMLKNIAGVAITRLTLVKLNNSILALASTKEQHQIVKEIETRLSVCDKLEATIAESLQKSEALRQSILKRAFEGKLLNEKQLEEARNAPDWEPADKLLERIKTEKEKTGNKKSF